MELEDLEEVVVGQEERHINLAEVAVAVEEALGVEVEELLEVMPVELVERMVEAVEDLAHMDIGMGLV